VKTLYVYGDFQKCVYQEWILALNKSFQRMIKGEDQFTKRYYVHATTNSTTTATFTATTTAAVAKLSQLLLQLQLLVRPRILR